MTSALLKGRFRVTRRRLSCGTRVLVVIFHLLADPAARFEDLGPTSTPAASTMPGAPTNSPVTCGPSAGASSSCRPPDHRQVHFPVRDHARVLESDGVSGAWWMRLDTGR